MYIFYAFIVIIFCCCLGQVSLEKYIVAIIDFNVTYVLADVVISLTQRCVWFMYCMSSSFSLSFFLSSTVLVNLYSSCDFFSLQGINIVGPSNAEPPPRPPSPAMYQLDIVLKKGNNLAIRDRTGRSSVCSSCYLSSIEVYV